MEVEALEGNDVDSSGCGLHKKDPGKVFLRTHAPKTPARYENTRGWLFIYGFALDRRVSAPHVEPPSPHCLLSSYLVAISGWPVVSAFSSGQSVELASGTFAGALQVRARRASTLSTWSPGTRSWQVPETWCSCGSWANRGRPTWARSCGPCAVRREFEVSVPVHLGRLLLAKLRKILLDDAWFCERISARPGTQGEARFPHYRRVRGDQVVCLPEGTARTLSDDHQDFLQAQGEQELQERKKVYRWGSRKDGPILPVAGGRRTQCDLPRNQRFLEDKDFDFRVSPMKAPAPGGGALKEDGETGGRGDASGSGARGSPQASERMSSERVRSSGKEDAFFGYQLLKGANPTLLRRHQSPSAAAGASGVGRARNPVVRALQNQVLAASFTPA
ncbi:LOW QUALITY PROTEIN: polyunsaturated fatty acid (12S)/(13S)-lipoxygenase, epidermal-type-like [Prionailurus viverrinus]|uniref:LOW QUALITY PROTEIN: polyunsaturated fatty acid (12S)/(13S)-lipoxygenase, epidermal-type-like n=1 Tax=Prionailurus viverrinus TaxID=61388 RepID=UPI001FF3BFA1|nr:LOW QUALITY PROTEIN: polyunsaturated fatty acid (12S)/(13S)-lipoxygenase, epidermal-type-like [Prionailurus viverrinus]